MNRPTVLGCALCGVTLFCSPTAHAQSPLRWTHVDSAPATRLGAALAPAGDLDQDGVVDLLVAAPRTHVGAPATGQVQVQSGRDGSTLLTLAAPSPSSWFGTAVAGGPDWTGDGVPDLLVGAPLGTPPSGSVFLFSGADGSLVRSFAGDQPGEAFGTSLCVLGDVNGDQIADLAVGAPHADTQGWNSGRVSIVSGATGATLHEFEGASGDFFGQDLARTCDMDRDGVPDLLVGVPFADASGFNSGRADLYSAGRGTRIRTFAGQAPGDWFGSRVAQVGDLNGDGAPDFGMGAPGSDRGGLDSGAVEVFSGADGALLFAVPGEAPGEFLQAVCGLGDTNEDGVPDFAVGSSSFSGTSPEAGRARILSGVDGRELVAFEGNAYDWFGASLIGIPSPSGRLDLAVGAPGHDDHTQLGYVRLIRATRLGDRERQPTPGPCGD